MDLQVSVPKNEELYGPILKALKQLGGSESNTEIRDEIVTALGLTQAQVEATYKSGFTILPTRLSFSQSALRQAGYVTNAASAVWALTEDGRAATEMPPAELKQAVAIRSHASLTAGQTTAAVQSAPDQPTEEGERKSWDAQLLNRLLDIEPAAFERLCQRLLRESGFVQVEVTGQSGDGGIDGRGILRVNLISFRVLFQCKRWKSSVGSPAVRDFRGGLQGRADRGLFITTSTFTADARKEAAWTPAIDLIDGETLCSLLKTLGLGVRTETKTIEDVVIDEQFFAAI